MTRTRAMVPILLAVLLTGCTPAAAPEPSSTPSQQASQQPSVQPSEQPSDEPSEKPSTPTDTRPLPADLRRLARAFIAYALEETDTLPVTESLWIGLDGQRIKAVDGMPDPLTDRRIWRICPAGAEAYAAWSCPIDVLGPIRAARVNDARLVLTRDTEVVCARVDRARPSGRFVAIRPERMFRTCASDFAIVLRADARGRLVDVDLTVSEP